MKRLVIGIVIGVLVVIVIGFVVTINQPADTNYTLPSYVKSITFYDKGQVKPVGYTEGLSDLLILTLQSVNIQAKCVLTQDDVNRLKANGKLVELVFSKPVDITIAQWVKPEDRSYIPTNESGYRVLKDVETVIFVLEGDLKGHILTLGKSEFYSCWAILRNGSIDKSWTSAVLKNLGGC